MDHFRIDSYITDVLMRDLVGHDHSPASFVVYLFLWRRTVGTEAKTAKLSHQMIANETGLSRSSVQLALRTLKRRRLVSSEQARRTDVPEHRVHTPWVRR